MQKQRYTFGIIHDERRRWRQAADYRFAIMHVEHGDSRARHLTISRAPSPLLIVVMLSQFFHEDTPDAVTSINRNES